MKMNEQKSKSLDLMKIALAAGNGSALKSDSEFKPKPKSEPKSKKIKPLKKIDYITCLTRNLTKTDRDLFDKLKENFATELSFDKYIAEAVREKLKRDMIKLYE